MTIPKRPVINDETLYEAWSEFRYPRPAVDEPSEAFLRAIRAIDTRLPMIIADELERLADELPGIWKRSGSQYAAGRGDAAIFLRNRAADLRGSGSVVVGPDTTEEDQ